MRRGLITSDPLAVFKKMTEEPRDRVLSEDERERLLSVLRLRNSYLYFPVVFSLKNPIRKGDLIALKRENLDMFRPWVHFYLNKTRKKNRAKPACRFSMRK